MCRLFSGLLLSKFNHWPAVTPSLVSLDENITDLNFARRKSGHNPTITVAARFLVVGRGAVLVPIHYNFPITSEETKCNYNSHGTPP